METVALDVHVARQPSEAELLDPGPCETEDDAQDAEDDQPSSHVKSCPYSRQTDAVSTRDPHSSFIKTPKQLIVVILLSFVEPIVAIILLVQLVVSRPAADPNAMTDEAIAKRLQPIGRVEFGAAGSAAGSRTGEQVYKAVCTNCHQTGVAGAPKLGDKAAWAPRIKEGLSELVGEAIKGVRAMPPRGGDPSLTDDEVARAVVYMSNQSGAKFKAPAASKPQSK